MNKKTLCILLTFLIVLCLTVTSSAEAVSKKGTLHEVTPSLRRVAQVSEKEPNDSRSTANPIAEDSIITGDVGYAGDDVYPEDLYDYFYINLVWSGRLYLDAISGMDDGTTRFRLYDSKGNLLETASRTKSENTDDYFSLEYDLEPGVYYIRVSDAEYWVGYQFSVEILPRLDTPLISGSANTSTGKYTVRWNAVDGADSYRIGRATSADGSYSTIGTITGTSFTDSTAKEGTRYYYKVRAISDDGYYLDSALSNYVTNALKTPTVSASINTTTGKPIIKWNSVSGAAKYRIGRSTSKDGTYSTVGTVSGTSFTDTTAVAGKLYYYKVRALYASAPYADSLLSDYVSKACDCERPVASVSNKTSTGKNVIKWNAVSGASKYQLYFSTSKSGTYSLLTTTTGTSITHSSGKAGTTYYYKVKAISAEREASNSAFSEVVYRTCDLAQPAITLSNVASSGKIKISWKAISGTDEYRVYYSTNGSDWSLLKAVTGTSLTHSSAKAGKTYYYKVRAMSSHSGAHSAYSAAKNRTCDLPRPSLTVKLNSDGNPRLTWDAVDGAVKYQVYRSKNNEDWTLLKTTTGTALTNTSVMAGRKYYYKVKAIAESSSANSAFSSVKSITAK